MASAAPVQTAAAANPASSSFSFDLGTPIGHLSGEIPQQRRCHHQP
jgi:hypothetical protein